MLPGELGFREQPCRLDHDFGVYAAPRDLHRVTFAEYGDLVAVNGDAIFVVGDVDLQVAMYRIVLEQMCQGLVVGDVIETDDFEIGVAHRSTEYVPSDAAKSIDCNFHRH